jgi:predicted deacylase
VIDFHCGPVELATNHVLVPDFEGEYGSRVTYLSQVYGLEILHLGSAYGGSLSAHAATLGVPTVVAEVGGGPTLDDCFVNAARRGVFNVMKDLAMIPGEPGLPDQQILVKEMSMLRIGHGGLFYPAVRLSQLGQVVPRGTLLGSVISTHSLKELETLRAPYGRTLLILVRDALSRVQPGDFAYFLGNMGSSETIRRDGAALPSL